MNNCSFSRCFITTILSFVIILSFVPLEVFGDDADALHNPVISDGITTWDVVEFGSYPQAEIVQSSSQQNSIPQSLLQDGDIIIDGNLYNQLNNYNGWESKTVSLPGQIVFKWSVASINNERYFRLESSGEVSYFKCQPIKWRVLKKDSSARQLLLISDKILDNDNITVLVPRTDNYLYNYVTSDFPQIAFTDNEKASIIKHNNFEITPFSDVDLCNENANYGFSKDRYSQDSAKQSYSTTYAKRKGIAVCTDNNYYGCSCWGLLSDGPGDPYDPFYASAYVGNSGRVTTEQNGDYQHWVNCGFRPVITIDLDSTEWHYAGSVSSHDTYEYVNEDTSPIVKSVKVSSETVNRPGYVTVLIEVTSKDTGIVNAGVGVTSEKGETANGTWEGNPVYDGVIPVNVPLGSNMKTGEFTVTDISLGDTLGHGWGTGAEIEKVGCKMPSFSLQDEFNYQLTIDISNPALADRLKGIQEGKAVRVNLNKGTDFILPKAAFEAIKGKDVTIVAYNSSYQWVFNGLVIDNYCKDVDLTTTISTISKEDYEISDNMVAVNFAPNGLLPGKAQVRLKSDYLYNLNNIKGQLLLYYDNNGVLELQNSPEFDLVFDGTDKWCYFTVDHNSRYIISGSAINKLEKKKESTPKAKNSVVKGKTYKQSGNSYKVMKVTSSSSQGTVAYTKAKNAKSVVIPATVKLKDGKTYKVTQINEKAFTGKKIRTITVGKNVKTIKKNAFKGSKATKLIIKTKNLKKSTVKGSLIGSKIKTIQIKIGSKKVNKNYLKKYKKIFTKANAGKKVTVK